MTERVLNAADIRKASNDAGCRSVEFPFVVAWDEDFPAIDEIREWRTRFARAVEAAVLAKVNEGVRKALNYMHFDGAKWWCNGHQMITEREALLRERKAYYRGRQDSSLGGYDRCNERYPLPTCDKCGQELP